MIATTDPLPVEFALATVERRSTKRFPIERPLRYSLVTRPGRPEEWLSGQTTDISSGGILFSTAATLCLGRRLWIEVDWPVLLNDRISLKLVVFGRVVRCQGGSAAVVIDRYQFRTQGTLWSRLPTGPLHGRAADESDKRFID